MRAELVDVTSSEKTADQDSKRRLQGNKNSSCDNLQILAILRISILTQISGLISGMRQSLVNCTREQRGFYPRYHRVETLAEEGRVQTKLKHLICEIEQRLEWRNFKGSSLFCVPFGDCYERRIVRYCTWGVHEGTPQGSHRLQIFADDQEIVPCCRGNFPFSFEEPCSYRYSRHVTIRNAEKNNLDFLQQQWREK